MFVSLKDVSKRYGKGDALVNALDHVSVDFNKGEIVVILGPSGSGKSTLLNILGGLDSADEGKILTGEYELSALNQKQKTDYRRNEVGFVFQSYNLISDLTVRENIEVIRDISKNPLEISDVLEALDLTELRNRFPDELSGGQQQRVAIARAMIKAPSLLLCDELTGALDSKTSLGVLEYIEKLNKTLGTTIIIITHNEAIAAMADTIIRLKDGKIAERKANSEKIAAGALKL